nr:immunoglobulin heavy chain junction region [Mus musculus]
CTRSHGSLLDFW